MKFPITFANTQDTCTFVYPCTKGLGLLFSTEFKSKLRVSSMFPQVRFFCSLVEHVRLLHAEHHQKTANGICFPRQPTLAARSVADQWSVAVHKLGGGRDHRPRAGCLHQLGFHQLAGVFHFLGKVWIPVRASRLYETHKFVSIGMWSCFARQKVTRFWGSYALRCRSCLTWVRAKHCEVMQQCEGRF